VLRAPRRRATANLCTKPRPTPTPTNVQLAPTRGWRTSASFHYSKNRLSVTRRRRRGDVYNPRKSILFPSLYYNIVVVTLAYRYLNRYPYIYHTNLQIFHERVRVWCVQGGGVSAAGRYDTFKITYYNNFGV